MLEAFYTDLLPFNELDCGNGGDFLSLADNVVMIVTGDTPKNSFMATGWPDGTPGNANWMYVRSNGFTKPGWFGDVSETGRTNFDPNTGMPAMVGIDVSTDAAVAGTLFAIARGDAAAIQPFTSAPFGGVVP
jgi:hypothetical protein